ncbi:MAG: hypothetical protein H7274_24845 [Rhodoferax sp.]|nr:hypothetical protein [Rhodoferax sp.]
MHHISCLFSPRSLIPGIAFLCGASAAPLFAQTPAAATVIPPPASTASTLADKPCILAGRLNADNRWAPLARGVTLLNAQGEGVGASSKKALDTVTAVRISEPALLSQCNGSQPLVSGESTTGSKTPVPAIKPGPIALNVEAIYYPPVRAGGQWVELQLLLPADRVVTAAR